jgi:predicted Zn-dependent protease
VIQIETKTRYVDACKDIRDVMLDKCPIDLISLLSNERVTQLLRRWALGGDETQGDIREDFQAILRGLDNAIEAISDHPCLYVMRGRALMAIGWHAVAIQDFENAVLASFDSADLYLFLAEAHFAQGFITKSDPLACYMSAAFHATQSIQYHTARQGSPRPYLCRARSDAYIMKVCASYHQGTPMFDKKYRDIQCDLQEARRYADEGEQGRIDVVEDNIDALLGIDRV